MLRSLGEGRPLGSSSDWKMPPAVLVLNKVTSAVLTVQKADHAIGKINRRADQGTGKNGHLAKH